MAVLSKTWYVYTLSYKNYVFYVGITTDPVARFSQHTNAGPGIGTFEYMYWIIERGEMADLRINIITHTLNKDAANGCEEGIIRYLSSLGNKLCNCDYNRQDNILITCRPPSCARIRKKLPQHILEVTEKYNTANWERWKLYGRTKSLYENKRN